MVIAPFKDPKSSSPAAFTRGFFSPFADGKIVFGFKKSSPVLFVAVKSCGDGDDIVGSFGLKRSLNFFQESFPTGPFRMEITH